MIPVGPIAFVVARMLRGGNTSPRRPTPGADILVMRVIALLLLLVFTIPQLATGWRLPLAIGALVSLIVSYPTGWVRACVFIGAPEIAYLIARWLRPYAFAREKRTGPVFVAALALRRRSARRHGIAYVEAKLEALPESDGALLVAAGLLAAAKGNRDRARVLLGEAAVLPTRELGIWPRGAAREWLSADAVQRGDWERAIALGGRPRVRFSLLMALCARRRIGEAVHPFSIWSVWLLAPHRLSTFSFVRATLRKSLIESTTAPAERDVLAGALELHARALSAASAERIESAAQRWDALGIDGAAMRAIGARAEALGARISAHEAVARMREVARDQLAQQAIERACRLRANGAGTLSAIAVQLREHQLQPIEREVGDIRRRRAEHRPLGSMEEWAAWARLRAACDAAIAARPEERRMVFDMVYFEGCNWACELEREYDERALAYAMFAWLLEQATAVNAPEPRGLLMRNCKATEGRGVRRR